jgi:hypothetical protein
VVNDVYQRFIRPGAPQKELVLVGRVATALMMAIAAVIALKLRNALQAFQILLQIGAGTGLLFILRWFWWRINAVSELTAMIVSFLVACYFQFVHARVAPGVELADWQKLILGVAVTTAAWVGATFLTRPSDERVLRRFCRLVNAGGPGWAPVFARAAAEHDPIVPAEEPDNIPLCILCMVLGCVAVYGFLFAAGCWLYRSTGPATTLTAVAVVAGVLLFRLWGRANRSSTRRQ